VRTVRECCLCSQIEGQAENDLIARMLPDQPYVRRVMLESASFAVIPSLGPLVSGHSLLCPKTHFQSFTSVAGELHAEFDEIKAKLRTALGEIYGTGVYVFEHGMAATGDRILCSVDHAHIHFLPLPPSFNEEVDDDKRWIEYDGSLPALQHLTNGREYILYEKPDGVCRVLTGDDGPFESQYMRKAIYSRLERATHWNWREAPAPLAADETWRRFTRR
jgi:ATP adenylyltransferase